MLRLIDVFTDSDATVCGACIDSRLVKPGDLFFALKGARHDGHHYLKDAAARGASAAVVSQSYQDSNFGMVLIRVEDVVATLQQLAKKYLEQQKIRVIAITGSLGKTTTKEFAKTLIGSSYRVFATPLSYNSQVTVPMSILSIRGDEEIMILEMGMSAPGHLAKLINIAPPDTALITTVASQHALGFEDGLAGIAQEKSSIFTHLKTKIGLYHHDMPYASHAQIGSCEKITFSCTDPAADFFLHREGSCVTIREKDKTQYSFNLQLPVQAHDHNFLAALSLARLLGIPWPVLKEMTAFLKLPPMRFEKIEKQGITFINDAYNAIPQSIRAALQSLPNPQGGRTVAVLSEMDALGEYSEKGHQEVGQCALEHADALFCVGNRCKAMEEIWQTSSKLCRRFDTVKDLGDQLVKFVQKGDVVLLKGARAFALDKLLNLWDEA
ncbi:MAG: UDP-N-acetylmuramoyl-tripeptide--D-alanyl-D-alanine ligase [Verrucomicrobia bacterium]|nr:UDP-N-acetylmuramoyl-tripeptide--D-alanyl-D-alanine ligase [Verrucomicrobiota bacterium]